MAAPSQAEQLLFGSVFLFAAPLLFFVWGLWLLMGPISHLRFIFPNLSANETTLYNSIFFVEIRIGAIITMTLATVFWLALRRANNRVTFTCLIATALACIISAAMYIHFLQPTAHHQQPAPATLGTVLSLIIWIGYALLAFLACMRLYLNKSLHRGLSKATGLTLFEILFVFLLPLFILAFGLWKLAHPYTFVERLYPEAKYHGAGWVYSSELMVITERLAGASATALAVCIFSALNGADTRTSAQILGATGLGGAASLIAYSEVYALGQASGLEMIGPLVFYFFVVTLLVACFLYSGTFYFGSFRREPLSEPAPFYQKGTAFEYAV
eukprot:tig00000144_g9003.t1